MYCPFLNSECKRELCQLWHPFEKKCCFYLMGWVLRDVIGVFISELSKSKKE